MKPYLSAMILLLAFACVGNGDEASIVVGSPSNVISTLGGKVYRDAKILRREGQSVILQHESGVSTVAIDSLIPEWRDAIYHSITSSITAKSQRAENLCPSCLGVGFARCGSCQGGKFGLPAKVKVECSDCDGSGRKSHFHHMGTIHGGAGARNRDLGWQGTKTCPKCDGTGKVEVDKATYCKECGGTGATRCTVCQGSGKQVQ